MLSRFRVLIVLTFVLTAGLSMHQASAQMQHFTLNVVVQTEDGADVPVGQVCVSGEVDNVCQDIPAGTPSGREFAFDGLGDGDHDVTVTLQTAQPAGTLPSTGLAR